MSPLQWLAVPVLATVAAALLVPVLYRRRRAARLSPAQRADRLRRVLAEPRIDRRGDR